jgi:uncharacterized protein
MLLKKGVAEQLYPKTGGKSVRFFMDQALTNGVQFVACLASMDLNDLKKEDLGFELPMVGVAESLPYLGGANKLVSF